ncbi:ClpXP protease specificity-enhancing factor [Hydrogenophaga sp.]|uniref:ClpXP protease specificity-enhancing factor n=1 Tax=Hydrogenophaga sp. TaxID=1904254 RepID=UPI00263123E6|nr:ClpXP protease specificity-enhancing factor [Hydrogenophaga sp.]MDM7949247.1 ClpXP protease specificity-enhancing factor [Hydrogenophaga sp.]
MTPAAQEAPSTRPYLVRALHEWCSDNGFSPYIAVQVDGSVQVPMEFVKNGEIVLNVSFDATTSLRLGNDFIEFKARFGGVARDIVVPIDHVIAIYARENGQGMAFPAPAVAGATAPVGNAAPRPSEASSAEASERGGLHVVPSDSKAEAPEHNPDEPPPPGAPPRGGRRPQLRRVK